MQLLVICVGIQTFKQPAAVIAMQQQQQQYKYTYLLLHVGSWS